MEPTQDLEGTVVEQHKSESSEIEERELSRPSSDLQNQAEGGKQTKEQEMAQVSGYTIRIIKLFFENSNQHCSLLEVR